MQLPYHRSRPAALQVLLIGQQSQDGRWGSNGSRTAREKTCHSTAELHSQPGILAPPSSEQGRLSSSWRPRSLGSSGSSSSSSTLGCRIHQHSHCSVGSKWGSPLLRSSSSAKSHRREQGSSPSSPSISSLGSPPTWLWWRA